MFGEVNDKQLEYLHDIHSSGQHLLTLINDILDLSKIEAGRMELDLASTILPMLLDNCTTLVRERASRQGLILALEVEHGLGEWVADVRKVKQVVINLLSNAVKFTPAGGRVTLRARRLEHAGRDRRRSTPASASPRTSRRWSSRSSARPAATTCASRRARASACRWRSASSSCTAADPRRQRAGPRLDLRLYPSRAGAGGAA